MLACMHGVHIGGATQHTVCCSPWFSRAVRCSPWLACAANICAIVDDRSPVPLASIPQSAPAADLQGVLATKKEELQRLQQRRQDREARRRNRPNVGDGDSAAAVGWLGHAATCFPIVKVASDGVLRAARNCHAK